MPDSPPSSGEQLPGDPPGVEYWGVDFVNGEYRYHEGTSEDFEAGLELGSWWSDAIAAAAGDVVRWLKHAYHAVANFLVKIEKSVVTFFVKIAEQAFKLS